MKKNLEKVAAMVSLTCIPCEWFQDPDEHHHQYSTTSSARSDAARSQSLGDTPSTKRSRSSDIRVMDALAFPCELHIAFNVNHHAQPAAEGRTYSRTCWLSTDWDRHSPAHFRMGNFMIKPG